MTISKQDEPIATFSMAIQKANIDENGLMRWRSVNSDIEEDFYGEKMSLELFSDFNKHIESNEGIPEVFKSVICEEDWCGGTPYLSIAHYKSGSGKVNVPGEVQSVYVDGKALKSKGFFYDTPLGHAVFKSLRKDIDTKAVDNKVRISIGFLDLEHEHVGEGGVRSVFTRKSLSDKCRLCKTSTGTKIYKKGHLVHLALTRVPANPRTDIEVTKSMTTKLEDAKSIIQDEDIENTLELKSLVDDALVIKAEETPEPVVEPVVEQSAVLTQVTSTSVFDQNGETLKSETVVTSPASTTTITDVSNGTTSISAAPFIPGQVVTSGYVNVQPIVSPLQQSFAALEQKAAVIKSQGLSGDAALKELQNEFEKVGETLKAEFTVPPSPQDVANQNLEATLRSLLSEMLPQALAQTVAPMQSEISELRALSLVSKPIIKKEEVVPQPRNLTNSNMNLVQKAAIEKLTAKAKDQFQALAEASVFI